MSEIHLNPTTIPAIRIIDSVENLLALTFIKNGVIVAIAKPLDVKEEVNFMNDKVISLNLFPCIFFE